MINFKDCIWKEGNRWNFDFKKMDMWVDENHYCLDNHSDISQLLGVSKSVIRNIKYRHKKFADTINKLKFKSDISNESSIIYINNITGKYNYFRKFYLETLRISKYFGNILENNKGDKYKVIGMGGIKNGSKQYIVEFVKTNYQTLVDSRFVYDSSVHLKAIKDPFKKCLYDIGYTGNYSKSDYPDLYAIWTHMLSRCYKIGDDRFAPYGGVGVHVCKRWLCFENFVDDVIRKERFSFKKLKNKEIQLDKDFLQVGVENKVYSDKTTWWIPSHLNDNFNSSRQVFFKAKKKGEVIYDYSYSNFYKGLDNDFEDDRILGKLKLDCEVVNNIGWEISLIDPQFITKEFIMNIFIEQYGVDIDE